MIWPCQDLYHWPDHIFTVPHYPAAAAAKSLQSCPTLCDPIDSNPPGSPVPGILQARTLEWVAIPSPMHESEKWKWSRSVVSDSSDPTDCSPSGSSVHGIFQAGAQEWAPSPSPLKFPSPSLQSLPGLVLLHHTLLLTPGPDEIPCSASSISSL